MQINRTKLNFSTTLESLAIRMTVALLNRAVNDPDADAEKLCDVAHLVCKSLKNMPQTDSVNEALRWANRAMAYDDDASLARWCLVKAVEALQKGAMEMKTNERAVKFEQVLGELTRALQVEDKDLHDGSRHRLLEIATWVVDGKLEMSEIVQSWHEQPSLPVNGKISALFASLSFLLAARK